MTFRYQWEYLVVCQIWNNMKWISYWIKNKIMDLARWRRAKRNVGYKATNRRRTQSSLNIDYWREGMITYGHLILLKCCNVKFQISFSLKTYFKNSRVNLQRNSFSMLHKYFMWLICFLVKFFFFIYVVLYIITKSYFKKTYARWRQLSAIKMLCVSKNKGERN